VRSISSTSTLVGSLSGGGFVLRFAAVQSELFSNYLLFLLDQSGRSNVASGQRPAGLPWGFRASSHRRLNGFWNAHV